MRLRAVACDTTDRETRLRTTPLWTVQFHPEITAAHRDTLVDDFGWEAGQLSFEAVTTSGVFENFKTLVSETRA